MFEDLRPHTFPTHSFTEPEDIPESSSSSGSSSSSSSEDFTPGAFPSENLFPETDDFCSDAQFSDDEQDTHSVFAPVPRSEVLLVDSKSHRPSLKITQLKRSLRRLIRRSFSTASSVGFGSGNNHPGPDAGDSASASLLCGDAQAPLPPKILSLSVQHGESVQDILAKLSHVSKSACVDKNPVASSVGLPKIEENCISTETAPCPKLLRDQKIRSIADLRETVNRASGASAYASSTFRTKFSKISTNNATANEASKYGLPQYSRKGGPLPNATNDRAKLLGMRAASRKTLQNQVSHEYDYKPGILAKSLVFFNRTFQGR